MKRTQHIRMLIVRLCSLVAIGALLGAGTSPAPSRAAGAIAVPLGDTIGDSSPAAYDFNGDGRKEIVVGGDRGNLFVFAYSGSTWSVVWSRQTRDDLNAAGAPGGNCRNSSVIKSSPAVGDLNNDGKAEIAVSVGGIPGADHNGGVLVYSYQQSNPWSFAVASGWPKPRLDKLGAAGGPDGCWDGFWSSPAMGDIDGDGQQEVVVLGLDRHIHAWNYDGSAVAGWPIYRYTDESDSTEGTDCLLRGGWSSPALGDIDGDGLPEVVVGTDSPPWSCPGNWEQINYRYGTVWAINGDSSNVPGWPVTTQNNVKSSPAIGDIDGDGEMEVVASSADSDEGGNGRYVYAWNANGSPVPGWPKVLPGDVQAPPALGDLDGDGRPEVVVGCGTVTDNCGRLYAWRGDGSSYSGHYPVSLGVSLLYAPVLADYDGDGKVEILQSGLGSPYLAAVEADGSAVNTTSFDDPGPLFSSPLVDDVDGDGALEVVIGAGAYLYIWNVSGTTDDPLPWPMFHRDAQRTGAYLLSPRLGFQDEIRVYHQAGSGSVAYQLVTIRNLGDVPFDWQIQESISRLAVSPSLNGTVVDASTVQLEVNVQGLAAGSWHNLGSIRVSGTWNGGAVANSPQDATLYVYVGDIQRVHLPVVGKGYQR